MKTSEQLNELAAAMAKAQGEIETAHRDSANPFFKSRYADLASVWDACREPLSKNGLAVIQLPRSDGAHVTMETRLLHSSGQWIEGELTTVAKDEGPQSIGSAVTYLRRYMLQAITGVAPDDDDGEAAMGRGNGHAQPARQTAKKPADDPIERAKEKAAAPEKTGAELYAEVKAFIAKCKAAHIPSVRARITTLVDEGKLDLDQSSTLMALVGKREDELEAVPA